MTIEHSPVRNTSSSQITTTEQQAEEMTTEIQEDGDAAVVATTSLQKLPAFWAEQPRLWFIQVESVFSLSRISRDETKYAQIIANLDPSYLKFIGDIILAPPADRKYEAIKERLIASFAISEEAKLKKLFSGLIMGDQKPSHFLQAMKSLAAGNNVGDNVLKTLFLDQLPESIRSILATSNADLSELAQQADKIMDIAHPQVSSIAAPDFVNSLTGKIDALEKKFEKFFTDRRRNDTRQSRQRYRSSSKPRELCWYHHRFGSKATKCIQPCKFEQTQKN